MTVLIATEEQRKLDKAVVQVLCDYTGPKRVNGKRIKGFLKMDSEKVIVYIGTRPGQRVTVAEVPVEKWPDQIRKTAEQVVREVTGVRP